MTTHIAKEGKSKNTTPSLPVTNLCQGQEHLQMLKNSLRGDRINRCLQDRRGHVCFVHRQVPVRTRRRLCRRFFFRSWFPSSFPFSLSLLVAMHFLFGSCAPSSVPFPPPCLFFLLVLLSSSFPLPVFVSSFPLPAVLAFSLLPPLCLFLLLVVLFRA